MMDSALTLAIGAVAVSPSDPTTVFVGTGEAALCGSGCFIGVGLYRITNAKTNPVLSGPLNKDASNNDVFTGRAVSEVIVHPTDPNILFVATTSGIAGIGQNTTGLSLPNAGIYRTTNAMSANPVFQKLTIQGTLSASRSVTDLAIEPDNPARLIAGVIGSGGDGGIYLSTNALDSVPTFTRTLTTGDGSTAGRAELAVNKANGIVTVYAAHGTGNGTLSKSVDGGATFSTAIANGFCSSQCFYDIAVAVDPVDPNKVYLGGSPSLVFGRSTNGGTSFTSSSTNLHVDTQAIALAPSNPNIMYFGSDGGVWKTTDVTATPITWSTLNNSTLSATQFMSIALHPTDRNYAIGGTQDNGTQFLAPDGLTWIRSDGGDGGFSVIDKESPNTSNTVAYHTYYNSSGSQIGFARAVSTVTPGDPVWAGFYGCGGTANGINCADAVLFYAPMAGGPTPSGNVWNTLYFGTTRLYRSIDRGTTMTDVSGVLPARISAIAIAPQNDDIRLVGTTNGAVYLSTTAGATSMTNVTGSIPARYVGRIAIDPTNSNIAYVGLNGFGLASGQHIWKTTNLLSGTPTWSPAGSGIPDTPVDSMAIDPANTQIIYAGTDIGVFQTSDGGANWIPFSNGLPRVAVFGMEIQPTYRILKIATHGRGIWEYNLQGTRSPYDFDGDGKTDLSIFRPSGATGSEWWYLRSSNGSNYATQFGSATDKLAAADYTGDGKTDVAFWRPSTGEWFILRSEDSTFYAFPFGSTGDVPAPADYDGDGKADAAVFRPSSSTWFIQNSGGGTTIQAFGSAGDVPVAGDYDGDGKADIAIFRPNGTTGSEWWILRSTAGLIAMQFGAPTDKTVVGDYTGDGKADVAFWRPSTGEWYILRSEDFVVLRVPVRIGRRYSRPRRLRRRRQGRRSRIPSVKLNLVRPRLDLGHHHSAIRLYRRRARAE